MSNPTAEKSRLDSVILTRCERTREGFLKAPAVVTRAGIFEYRRSDGSVRRELRRPEQVFRADSMASVQNIPFVDEHPYRDGGFVTSQNARRLSRGYSGSPSYKDGNNLCVDVIVTDADTIAQIEAGKKQLSLGYTVNTIEVPGEWLNPETGRTERYDAEQIDIKGNHIASVKVGRAGNAELRLDANLNADIPQERDMVQIKLDNGKIVEVTEEVAEAFHRESKRADDAERLFVESDTTVQTLTGEKEGLTKRLDEAENSDKFNARVKARVALLSQAHSVLPKAEHTKLDAMSDVDIMQAVIRCDAGEPELKFEGHTPERIMGRFDQVMAGRKSKSGDGGLGAKILEGRLDGDDKAEDGKDQDPEMARKKKLTERWKEPVKKGKKDGK